MHALIGSGVLLVSLVVGVWALVVARRHAEPSGALTGGTWVALALLVTQILAGADLLSRGLVPIAGPLEYVHVGGPVIALAGAAFHVFGRPKTRARNYAIAMLTIFVFALLSYVLGEIGSVGAK
jgi:hypothetical protein